MSRWRLSDWTLGLLVALAMLAMWEAYLITNRTETRGCGGNFSQYYIAGAIVGEGETSRLYDQPYFMEQQKSLREDPLPSIYPPSVALVMAPLAKLPYNRALALWWAIHAVCLAAVAVLFYRTSTLARPWRINMLVALAALMPLWIGVGIGQWAPIFLLVVAGGFELHKRGNRMSTGFILSLLALKPQLAAGLVLWMLLRRDLRTLFGLAMGFAVQSAAVVLILGPQVWRDYLHALPVISAMTRRAHFSPMVEASFVGMASNLYWMARLSAWEPIAMKFAYALSVSVAAVMLCRVVWSRRPLGTLADTITARSASEEENAQVTDNAMIPSRLRFGLLSGGSNSTERTDNTEYACGVLFMLMVPPYLIVYDQTLMAVALVALWSSPAWRWGVLLFAASTALAANLSLTLGFSLTGLAALATMWGLVVRAEGSRQPETDTARTAINIVL